MPPEPSRAYAVLARSCPLIVLLLTGCTGPSGIPVQVGVGVYRAGVPVEGARVVSHSTSRDHPFSVETLLGKTGPIDDVGETDADGEVTLEVFADRDSRVVVITPPPQVEIVTLWTGFSTRWQRPTGVRVRDVGRPDGSALEVVIELE